MKNLLLTENKVHVSNEYENFKRIVGNRKVDQLHVKNIRNKMKVKDLKIPIILNGNGEVIDGQHRVQARKELNLPVYYIVIKDLGIEETQMANAGNKNWNADDFLHTYVEMNFFHYKKYKEFKEKYGFGHTVTTILLQGGTIGGNEDFNSGNFVIKDLNLAEKWAEKIMQVKPYYKGYNRRSFVFAMIKCFKNEAFDHDEFVSKLAYQSFKLVDCTVIEGYLRIIEDIYNYKRKNSDKIRLL